MTCLNLAWIALNPKTFIIGLTFLLIQDFNHKPKPCIEPKNLNIGLNHSIICIELKALVTS